MNHVRAAQTIISSIRLRTRARSCCGQLVTQHSSVAKIRNEIAITGTTPVISSTMSAARAASAAGPM